MNRWMSRRGIDVQGEEDHMSNDHGQVSPYVRAEVSKEVYGILRDNLPPALEAGTSQEELALIAESIERKLYATATSPLAYCSKFATLEFRITALATAVLIHSDRGRDREDDDDDDDRQRSGHQDVVSDTCARLSAAARKSLVYCVMVLVSYEKRNLDGYNMHRRRKRTAAHMENDCEVGSAHSRGKNKGYSSKAMVEETYSRHAAECHRRIRELERKYPNCQFEQPTSPVDFDQSAAGDDLQTITGEDSKVLLSPPSS